MRAFLDKALTMAVGANGALLFVVMNNGDLFAAQQIILALLVMLVVAYLVLGVVQSLSKKHANG